MNRGALLPLAILIAACGLSKRDVHALVARYNAVVSEAYRRADIKLIDEVVAPDSPDGKKLLGLIGVRSDLGITLDAHLLALEITNVEQPGDQLRVFSTERWRYRDIRIGSGQQVGEASRDSYEMLYLFKRIRRRWLVEETRFAAPPRVGRKAVSWGARPKLFHGLRKSTAPGTTAKPAKPSPATAPATAPASRPALPKGGP